MRLKWFRPAYALTGGGAGALDALGGAELADKDVGFVVTADGVYVYSLDADSGLAESSPDVIAPDNDAGDKRWILQSLVPPIGGIKLLDTDKSHYLRLAAGSDLSADRTLSLFTGDSDRTVTLSGNPTLNDWFDQAVKTTSDSLFNTLEIGTANTGVRPSLYNPDNLAGFSQLSCYPSSGTNVSMSLQMIPKGVGVNNNKAQFTLFGTDYIADAANYEFMTFRARNNDFALWAGRLGTGTQKPLLISANNLATNQLYLDTGGNVGLNATSFGTNATTVLALATGTAPASSPANMFQMYSADQVAGNACPHFRTEAGTVVKLYQQAHITDAPGDTCANNATTINAILVALENLGLLATS